VQIEESDVFEKLDLKPDMGRAVANVYVCRRASEMSGANEDTRFCVIQNRIKSSHRYQVRKTPVSGG